MPSSYPFSSPRRLLLALTAAFLLPPAAHAANIIVNSAADPAGFNPNVTIATLGSTVTLRDAWNAANNTGGDNAITFAPSLAGATISLSQTDQHGTFLLVGKNDSGVTSHTTILGPQGASGITIGVGAGIQKPLMSFPTPDAEAIYTFEDLTLSGASGNADIGAAISIAKQGYVEMKRCTVTNCTSSSFGAFYVSQGALSMVNCTVSGNSAGYTGGISIYPGSLAELVNCTIAGNTGGDGPGGLLITGDPMVTLTNTIIAGNTGAAFNPQLTGTVGAGSENNLIAYDAAVSGSIGITNGVNGNIIGVFPAGLGTLGDYGGPTQTIPLLAGSPAVNAGITDSSISIDQRGIARPQGSAPDIGAFETRIAPLSLATTSLECKASDPPINLLSATGPQPADGVFSGPGVSGGQFNPAAAPLGPNTLTYTVLGADGYPTTGTVTITVYEAPSLVVTTVDDVADATDGQTSLREAVEVASGGPGAKTITFAPALTAGGSATIALSSGWSGAGDPSALVISGNVTVRGPATGHGITITSASGVQKRHFFVTTTGTLSVSNLTFTNGYSVDYGGSIQSKGALEIRGCAFTGNHAGTEGGAIQSWGGSPRLIVENTTITGNSADGRASAIGAGAQTVTLSYDTITGNTGANGVLWIYRTPVDMKNSILAGNATDEIKVDAGGGTFSAGTSNNLIGAASAPGLTDGANANTLGVTAAALKIGPLSDNGGVTQTMALLTASPAINTGTAISGITTDQRGIARPQGSAPDIGAYEARLGAPITVNRDSVDVKVTDAAFNLQNVFGTSPSGGVWSGPGVTNGMFDPAVAGVGVHSITYSRTSVDDVVVSVTLTVRVSEIPSLVVNTTTDVADSYDAATSLREALAYAKSLGSSPTPVITFDSSLTANGPATIALSHGWADENDASALVVSSYVEIQGPSAAPGITITMAPGVQKRHFQVVSPGHLTISNLTFTNGYSADYGGSIQSYNVLAVRNCTFTGNHAGLEGGAIQTWAGAGVFSMENCTVTGNSSDDRASALGIGSPTTTLNNNTITGNTAPNGVLWLYNAVVNASNTIVAGNSTDDVAVYGFGRFGTSSANNILGASTVPGLTDGTNGNHLGVTATALKVGGLSDNGGPTQTIPLLTGSPALNAGAAISGITTDQRGIARPQGSAWDIGAFEARLPAAPTIAVSNIDCGSADPPFDLASASGAAPAGGAFSGDGVTNGQFDPSATTLGAHTITYSLTSEDGIAATTTFTVTVRATEAPGLVVTTTDDIVDRYDMNISLREAIGYAAAMGGARTITFAPSLTANGPATIALSHGWTDDNSPSALVVSTRLTIQGPAQAPGITITMASGVNKRHFEVTGYGHLTVANLAFTNGSADYGGSIYAKAPLTVLGCTFTGNHASVQGGAIAALGSGSDLNVTNSTITGNSAGRGSALALVSNTTVLNNDTITGNSSPLGALWCDYNAIQLYNTIFAGNSTDDARTGTYFNLVSGSANNIIGAATNPLGLTNGVDGNITGVSAADLKLGPMQDNGGPTQTAALLAGSPALDAGAPVAGVSADQRGIDRPEGAAWDIGAFEARQVSAPTAFDVTCSNTDTPFDLATASGAAPTGGAFSGPGVTNGSFDPASAPIGANAITYTILSADNIPSSVTFTVTVRQVEASSLVVTIPDDVTDAFDNQTSLREALAYATSLGGAQTITFDPALTANGPATVTLSHGWNGDSDVSALVVSTNVTLQGPADAPGVAITMAGGVQKRHIFVTAAGSLSVSNLTFSNGYSTDFGGAIQSKGSLTVVGCTFTGNHASIEGGAIQSWGGSPLLIVQNSTITGNSADGRASAIGAGAQSVLLWNDTITGNTGANGVLWIYQTTVDMKNTILAGNATDEIKVDTGGGTFSAGTSNNLIGAAAAPGLTDGANATTLGVSAADLKLNSLADNGGPTWTMLPKPGSPVLNAGTAIAEITTDQRGEPRNDGAPDIGAVEAQPGELPDPASTLRIAGGLQAAVGSDMGTDTDHDGLITILDAVRLARQGANP